MTTADPTDQRASSLRAGLRAVLRTDCPVDFPGDPGYAAAATPWNLAIIQAPRAVALPRSVGEVVDVVRAAAALGLRVAPQSTGHAADAVTGEEMADAILLRMDRMIGVDVDPELGTARIRGGTVWNDVLTAAAVHGFTALHGSAGDVAVCGFLLGGGLSFYGRKHGLAGSSVLSMDVVTADGQVRHAAPTSHPDLFWSLLGGGRSFGVVVAIEIALLPLTEVMAGMLLWDMHRAPEVVAAWAEWTRTAPVEATTALRLMRFPSLPELPPFLSGRDLVVVDGAVLGDDQFAAGTLTTLRALDPELDTFARIPARELVAVHLDPPVPTAVFTDHALLESLTDQAVAALLAAAGPNVDAPLMFAELRHLGGALTEPLDAALGRLDGEYALFAAGVVSAEAPAAVVAALSPWSTGALFANFHGRPDRTADCFEPRSWDRLRRARDLYDPRRMWVAAHPI